MISPVCNKAHTRQQLGNAVKATAVQHEYPKIVLVAWTIKQVLVDIVLICSAQPVLEGMAGWMNEVCIAVFRVQV